MDLFYTDTQDKKGWPIQFKVSENGSELKIIFVAKGVHKTYAHRYAPLEFQETHDILREVSFETQNMRKLAFAILKAQGATKIICEYE